MQLRDHTMIHVRDDQESQMIINMSIKGEGEGVVDYLPKSDLGLA